MTRDIERYQIAYAEDYNFEKVMVEYRGRLVIERIVKANPRLVLEIGCGADLLYKRYLATSAPVEKWLIVEPASEFARLARDSNLPNVHVIHDFFEQAVDRCLQLLSRPPELIICSSLLHEAPSATELLAAIVATMDERSLLHVNVPNAASFHRRLALAMGIISDLTAMSDRNRTMLQSRVFDSATLRAELSKAGLAVCDSGGYLIKPFTHKQMEAIAPALGDSLFDGLFQLGRQFPEWASEIFVEARLARDAQQREAPNKRAQGGHQ